MVAASLLFLLHLEDVFCAVCVVKHLHGAALSVLTRHIARELRCHLALIDGEEAPSWSVCIDTEGRFLVGV